MRETRKADARILFFWNPQSALWAPAKRSWLVPGLSSNSRHSNNLLSLSYDLPSIATMQRQLSPLDLPAQLSRSYVASVLLSTTLVTKPSKKPRYSPPTV